jgi:hypothetical protein
VDPVDQAIAASEPTTRPASLSVRLPSGRVVGLVMPADVTPAEVLDLIGFLSGGGLQQHMARRTGPAPRLLVPR